jgi:hypothetical protein
LRKPLFNAGYFGAILGNLHLAESAPETDTATSGLSTGNGAITLEKLRIRRPDLQGVNFLEMYPPLRAITRILPSLDETMQAVKLQGFCPGLFYRCSLGRTRCFSGIRLPWPLVLLSLLPFPAEFSEIRPAIALIDTAIPLLLQSVGGFQFRLQLPI